MSLKDAFEKSNSVISSKKNENLYEEMNSGEFVEQVIIDQERYLPNVDFSTASNFARYGSAEKYYSDAIKNIYQTYPYDGSSKEKQEWRNLSSQFDNYILDNVYPKTTGYLTLSGAFNNADGKNQYLEFFSTPNNPKADAAKSIASAFEYSKKYEPSKNRDSNLAINPNNEGNTIEFWLKINYDSSNLQNIFNVWNGINFYEDPTNSEFFSINMTGYSLNIIVNDSSKDLSLPINHDIFKWNHYCITLQNVTLENNSETALARFYINGKFISQTDLETTLKNNVRTQNYTGRIGAMQAVYDGYHDQYFDTDFGLNGCIDEFRFWKQARSEKDISRYWFASVDGGSDTDDYNNSLGIYYKFNEGIVGDSTFDEKVLDYSGRVSNAIIKNYTTNIRSTGSAIEEYSSQFVETKDPIIYPTHPSVVSIQNYYKDIGSLWDEENSSNIYKSIPGWIVEEQEKKEIYDLSNLIQIISSYFDTLHAQIETLPRIKDIEYISNQKPLPFISNILSSYDFNNLNLFTETSLLEELKNRGEDRLYDESIANIKNTIYQNIYNNLINIYKSKGTENSLRNLIRCFGVDDELVKIKLYSNNSQHTIQNNYYYSSTPKNFINFNNVDRYTGIIYQKSITGDSGTRSYILGNNSGLLNNVPITLQAEVIFPKKLDYDNSNYEPTPFTNISLFGVHTANENDENDLTWGSDEFKLEISAVKTKLDSNDVYFKLIGQLSDWSFVLTSSYFNNVYNEEKWNIAVRIKNNNYDVTNLSSGSNNSNYTLEFIGFNNTLDNIKKSFKLETNIDKHNAQVGLSKSKRIYAGAQYIDFDTLNPPVMKTDVKISSVRFWFDYIDDDEMLGHSYDSSNFGRKYPYRYINSQDNNINKLAITKNDALALNWDFNLVTSSNENGEFIVEDASSGSIEYANTSEYGWFGNVAKYRHTGHATRFLENDENVINKEYIYSAKLLEPEAFGASGMIDTRNSDDISYNKKSNPITYFFSVEKSMSQVINDEILGWFATIQSFNNLIGEPIERYRKEYKNLEHLRKIFFENVKNTPSFEKFLEFYKWIDSSITNMIQQLLPATANFSENVRNVVESHLLERNKYENKLPVIKRSVDPVVSISSFLNYSYLNERAPNNNITGSNWLKNRAIRTSIPVKTGDIVTDQNREILRKAILSKNINTIPKQYDINTGIFYESKQDFIRGYAGIVNISGSEHENISDSISPVNISNNLINSQFNFATSSLTGSGQILNKSNKKGNFLHTYEYFQTSGRTNNNKSLPDIIDQLNITSSNFITGIVDRQIPTRKSVKTIIVERFSAPGGPEVNSLGALDAEAEEFSVYNGLNNRNLKVRNQLKKWLAESSSIDQQNPSYHKTNKNTAYLFKDSSLTTQYNNSYIVHQIPRSDSQYAWITASLVTKPSASGFQSDFSNINLYNSSSFIFNTSSVIVDTNKYSTFDTSSLTVSPVNSLNINSYLLNRNGPYAGANWKRIRNSDNNIINLLRDNNYISSIDNSENTVLFKEPVIGYNNNMIHEVKDPTSKQNIQIYSSYDNNKLKFSNQDLNNHLALNERSEEQVHDLLNKIEKTEYIPKPQVVSKNYSQIIFPKSNSVSLKNTRNKLNYDDNGFTGSVVNERTYWRDDINNRDRSSGSLDLYGVFNNNFNSVPELKGNIFNSSSTFTISGIQNYRESIFALDSSMSSSYSSSSSDYKTTYNSFIKGNLAKNTINEEKYNILNNINYYMNSFVVYDKSKYGNLYNIKNEFKYLNFLKDASGNGYPSRPTIKSMLSTSAGIYLGGSLSDDYANKNIVLWNGNSFTDINSPINFASESYCMLSTSAGIYFGGEYGLYRYNGSSWTYLNTCPISTVYTVITTSAGIIAGGDSGSQGGISRYNGSTWSRVGAGMDADVYSLVSGSDALYAGVSTYVFLFGHTNNPSVYKFTGSLSTVNTSSFTTVGTSGAFDTRVFRTCYTLLSSSNGLYAGGYLSSSNGQTYIKRWSGITWQNLGDGLTGVVNTLASNSSGLYAGGTFIKETNGTRLNGVGNWDGTKWNYIGRSANRSGVTFYTINNIDDSVSSLYTPDNSRVFIGGTFNNIRSGPLFKNSNSNILIEAFSSSKDLLIPHPQLIFNNLYPASSGTTSLEVSGKTINNHNSMFVINDGYVYETDKVSGKKPFYDSYADYFEDIKPHSQKYSIIPEYRISDSIKNYVSDPTNFSLTAPKDYLKNDGSIQEKEYYLTNNSINITDTFKFNLLSSKNINKNNLEINIKVNGIKKLLPKKDFYPSERVVTLSNYFINSFLKPDITVSSSTDKQVYSSALSNRTPINGQIATLLQPLFAPGILLNTIKSSIAVDWPVYLTKSVSYDSSTFPEFYSSTGSNLITAQVSDNLGFGKTTSSYIAPNYLDDDPNFRLPFEALVNFDTVIPSVFKRNNSNLYYLNPTHYTSDILTGSDYDEISFPSYNLKNDSATGFGFKDANYQLAMHNFLAEIPNFFLNGGLTKFVSKKKRAYFTKDKEYYMDVVLKKSQNYSSFIADSKFEGIKNNRELSNIIDGTMLLYSPDSLYGPPSRFWHSASFANSLFQINPYNLYFKLLDTPAYAPYTPPYFYGSSVARIKFVPSETRLYTVEEILDKVEVEYLNNDADEIFKIKSDILEYGQSSSAGPNNYSSSVSYRNMMKVSSSINLFGTTPAYEPTINATSYQATEVINSDDKYWVIQTKFETPSINFADIDQSSNLGLSLIGGNTGSETANGLMLSNLFKGIWTTYGQPANKENGITIIIEDVEGKNSLKSILGFEVDSKQIGSISESKVIKEGVVLIPHTYKKGSNTLFMPVGEKKPGEANSIPPYYFKIDRNVIENLLKLPFQVDSNTTFDQIKAKVFSNDVDHDNSIVKLIKSMTQFVIPPHLDWLRNKKIDPFVMYIFEFQTELNKQDLSDVWQGLMPKSATEVHFDTVNINHKFGPGELFGGIDLPDDIKFKVFKVKQAAKINYFELTEDSSDDSGFKFKFKNQAEKQRPDYSYNWPYDFFSLVELVNVEASVKEEEK